MSITYVLVDENLDLLFEEMLDVFDSVQKIGNPERIIIHDIGATQQQVDTVVNAHVNTEFTTEQILDTAQSGLLDKAALAQQFAPDIRTLFNQVWDETENQTTQPNRFETLAALMESQSGALRNRFKTDLIEELNLDFDGLGADLAARLAAATAAQRRNYCLYLRTWIQGLVFLLIINKIV